MCNHKTCAKLHAKGAGNGVGVAVFEHYNGSIPVIMLGHERSGQYKGEMNMCAGKLDPSDGGCYIVGAKRELREEFKINVTSANFDQIFKNSRTNRVRVMMIGKTPIFIGVFHGISRDPINKTIAICNSTQRPHCEQEMNFVNWIDIRTMSPIDTKYPNHKISSFATSFISNFDVSRL
jgi:8-oxo-dGTP pyrophosphatase MutT (NUDIX family)